MGDDVIKTDVFSFSDPNQRQIFRDWLKCDEFTHTVVKHPAGFDSDIVDVLK